MTTILTIFLAISFAVFGPQSQQQQLPKQDFEGYKLGDLELTGSTVFALNIIRDKIFPISKEDPFDMQLIRKGLSKIRRMFFDLGYIDFVYTPDMAIDPNKKTFSCVFHLDQGKQYFINHINIFGVGSSEVEDEIRSVMSKLKVEENNFFSLTAFQAAFNRINELLETKDLSLKNYEYKRLSESSSEDSGAVDISFWFQPKER